MTLFEPVTEPALLEEMSRLTRRHRTGRRPRSPEPVTDEIQQLVSLALAGDMAHVQRFFNSVLNQRIDDELEAMALWVLSEWDPDVDTDKVKSLMAQGQFRMAVNATIAQMRRETAKELRGHKRGETDKFFDSCVAE